MWHLAVYTWMDAWVLESALGYQCSKEFLLTHRSSGFGTAVNHKSRISGKPRLLHVSMSRGCLDRHGRNAVLFSFCRLTAQALTLYGDTNHTSHTSVGQKMRL